MTIDKTTSFSSLWTPGQGAPFSRRRFLGYTGAALGAAALAGCGTSSGGGSGITLSQWYHQYGETGTQQAALRYAQEYSKSNKSGVTVKVNWVPGDYSGTKLPTALLSSNPPDIFEGSPTVAMVKAGQIEPLDDILTETKGDFNPVSLSALTVNGKVYGIKMIDDMGLLYYRKSMLQKANVQPPTTIDEVIAATKKLTGGNVKGMFAGNDGGINALGALMLWSSGGDYLNADNTKVIFNTERFATAVTKIRELNETNGLLLGSPTDWWDPSSFTQGLVAMQWTGLWAMPAITKALGDDFGVMPWPALDTQSKPSTSWGGWAQMVSPKGKHVAEAKAFDNVKDQQDWSLSYGFHVPPRKSAAASAAKLQSGPAAQAVQYLNQYGRVTPPQWDAAMGTLLTTAISNVVKNKANAVTELTKAAEACQTELDKELS